MKAAVRYHTRSGNTKKLAEAIAAEAGVSAADLSATLSEKADVLFLGSSLYAGNFDPAVGEFIEKNAGKIGLIACFGSSASGRSTFSKLKAFAESKGVSVCEEHFDCFGHFLFLHKNRPNEEDFAAAAAFAKRILTK